MFWIGSASPAPEARFNSCPAAADGGYRQMFSALPAFLTSGEAVPKGPASPDASPDNPFPWHNIPRGKRLCNPFPCRPDSGSKLLPGILRQIVKQPLSVKPYLETVFHHHHFMFCNGPKMADCIVQAHSPHPPSSSLTSGRNVLSPDDSRPENYR